MKRVQKIKNENVSDSIKNSYAEGFGSAHVNIAEFKMADSI